MGPRITAMSGRIRDTDVSYVRDHSPIDEVVSDYVQLKSACLLYTSDAADE